jgi:hypothetical protein
MMKLRRVLIAGLALTVILVACAPATSAPAQTNPVPQPTLPPSTAIPTHEPAGVGVPVFEYLNDRSELLVISSVTGKPLDEFAPIALGTNYSYAFSPDKSTLALVSDAQLYLIDLPSWKYRTADVGSHGWLSSMVYSPDGARFAFASGGPEGDLRVVDARSGEVRASAQAGFSITSARFTTDGKAIMVYGPHIAATGVAANAGVSVGAPRAALLASSDLSTLWSVELHGICAGTFPKKAGTEDTEAIYQPGAAWHFDPGIAFAPDRDVLYLVHGDADKLTTVDFATRKVRTVGIHAKLGWLDQLMMLTAGVAHAKGMDGTSKQALISPDGKYLYVVGSTEVVTMPTKGTSLDVTDTPIGLAVIATDDGTLVDKMDTEAISVSLSPDGMHVLLSGWSNTGTYGTSWTDVYDTASRSIVKHLDRLSLVPTRLMDGQAILGSSSNFSDSMCYEASVNPDTWAIAGNWKGACLGWLPNP